MANYNWDKFNEKHDGEIRGIAKAENCDMGVAREKLIYMAENPKGEKYAGISDGIDWGTIRADIEAVKSNK